MITDNDIRREYKCKHNLTSSEDPQHDTITFGFLPNLLKYGGLCIRIVFEYLSREESNFSPLSMVPV